MRISFCSCCGRGLVIEASATVKRGNLYFHKDWGCDKKYKKERGKNYVDM